MESNLRPTAVDTHPDSVRRPGDPETAKRATREASRALITTAEVRDKNPRQNPRSRTQETGSARARHGGNDALGRDARNAGSEVSTQSGSSLADERRGWAGLRPRWGGGVGARRREKESGARGPRRAAVRPGVCGARGRLVPAPAHHAAPPAAHRGLGREHQRLLVDAGHLRRALHDDSDAGQGQRHEPLFPALVLTHGRVRHLLRPGGP